MTSMRYVLLTVLAIITMASLPTAARADLLYCDDGTAEVYVARFIAQGRTQVDVAISASKSSHDVAVSISTADGQLLQTRTFDLTRIYDYTTDELGEDDYQDVAGMISFKNLPKTGGFVVTVGDPDPLSAYSSCELLTINVQRTPGKVTFRWVKTSYGYLLDPKSFALPQIGSGDYNYGKAVLGTCQTLPVGISGVVTISGSGVAGSGSRSIKVNDLCELVPGKTQFRRSQTAGAIVGSGRSMTVRPDYKAEGRQSYSMTLTTQGRTIRMKRTSAFRPAYRVWEGTDEYFNYCLENLFDVDIVMENGRRYCVKPAVRTF